MTSRCRWSGSWWGGLRHHGLLERADGPELGVQIWEVGGLRLTPTCN
jgi:hypothetical protein